MGAPIDSLEQLGLTKNEARVYTTLLKLKQALAGEITAGCGIHRRNVYDALERLQEKGLVAFTVINTKRYFQPASPQRLLELEEEKIEATKSLIPILENLIEKETQKHGVFVYTGLRGYKRVFEDVIATLSPRSEWYCMPIPYKLGVAKLIPFFLKLTHKRRVKKRIKFKAIFQDDEVSKQRAWEISQLPLTEIRILPRSKQTQVGLNVYGGKTAIVLAAENDEPIVIVMESDEIAATFKRFFESLWKEATPLSKILHKNRTLRPRAP